jgi:hypothetical protein
VISGVVVVVALGVLALSWITAGFGGALAAGGGGIVVALLTARRRTHQRTGTGRQSDLPGRLALARPPALGLIVTAAIWTLVSVLVAVVPDNGDRVASRLATWARDHRLGAVIDQLEAWTYSEPPSATPATDLAVTPVTPAPTTSTTTPAPTTTLVDATTTSGEPTTTLPPAPAPPAPLTPVIEPALDGEGQWTVVATAAGEPAMWATGYRPIADVGGIVATMVVLDQTHLRTALFNGSEMPGGGGWTRSNRVPAVLQPALIAAMNGGFRFDHMKGGYVTEGRVMKPLREGDATLAIDAQGVLSMGQLGRDIVDDGSWVSLRQNLELIVDDGRSRVDEAVANGVWWGADHGNAVYVKRSAVCTIADGRIAYVMAAMVDAHQLAATLIAMGCVMAMQMDINVDWPTFMTYTHTADGAAEPHWVDERMSGNPRRYLDGSSKEFFAFFDPTKVTPDALPLLS